MFFSCFFLFYSTRVFFLVVVVLASSFHSLFFWLLSSFARLSFPSLSICSSLSRSIQELRQISEENGRKTQRNRNRKQRCPQCPECSGANNSFEQRFPRTLCSHAAVSFLSTPPPPLLSLVNVMLPCTSFPCSARQPPPQKGDSGERSPFYRCQQTDAANVFGVLAFQLRRLSLAFVLFPHLLLFLPLYWVFPSPPPLQYSHIFTLACACTCVCVSVWVCVWVCMRLCVLSLSLSFFFFLVLSCFSLLLSHLPLLYASFFS